MKNLLKVALLFLCLTASLVSQERNPSIYVMITDSRGVKIYSENLPLINVMHLRDITTNNFGDFTFTFEIPNGWGLVFESEEISFASVGYDSVILNWKANWYYGFTITTQESRLRR